MAAVLMRGRDGRTALLAFTGSAPMTRLGPRGATGAGDPGAGGPGRRAGRRRALLVDVAGPVLFVVEAEDLPPWPEGSGWSPSRTAGAGRPSPLRPRGADVHSGPAPCTLVPDRSSVSARVDPTSGGLLPPASTAAPAPQVVGSGHEQGDATSPYARSLEASVRRAEAFFRSGQKSRCAVFSGVDQQTTPGGHISTELRINDRIRVPEVRLVGPNGETVGIVSTGDALRLAQEADLDLVEIAPHGPSARLQAHGLREVQVRERPEGP